MATKADADGVPPFDGGLHCGLSTTTRRPFGRTCSRRPTAGSIAARSWPRWRCPWARAPVQRRAQLRLLGPPLERVHVRWCSRRPTAGSIAARTGPSLSHGSLCRAPAVHRRAPLRHHVQELPVRHRHSAPAVQGRAPLRRAAVGQGPRRHPRAPAVQRRAPLRSGRGDGTRSGRAGCSRRSAAGSIAETLSPPSTSGTRRVLPPSDGGLHCGTVEAWLEAYDQPVFPSSNGGAHCCGFPIDDVDKRQAVFPQVSGRALLRLLAAEGSCRPAWACSCRSKAGSIAAGPSVVQRRAPLRPDLPDDAVDHPAGCSRRPTAGSIAKRSPVLVQR